jgi:hypothetical protein
VTVINNNQQEKQILTHNVIMKKSHGKMPVFICSCGAKILIVSDLTEMNKAIQNHIIEHKKLSGQILTEDNLTQEMLSVIIESINET